MATLTISDEQVLELVLQLPEKQRAWLFIQLAAAQWPSWLQLSEYGNQRILDIAAEHGLDWRRMSDEERDVFIDEMLHEQHV